MEPTAVRRIKLTQRKFALIDDVDYEKVSQFNWCYTAKSDELGYAKWRANVRYQGKLVLLGDFNEKTDAAIAYNKKAQELFGEFANLNKIEV